MIARFKDVRDELIKEQNDLDTIRQVVAIHDKVEREVQDRFMVDGKGLKFQRAMVDSIDKMLKSAK